MVPVSAALVGESPWPTRLTLPEPEHERIVLILLEDVVRTSRSSTGGR